MFCRTAHVLLSVTQASGWFIGKGARGDVNTSDRGREPLFNAEKAGFQEAGRSPTSDLKPPEPRKEPIMKNKFALTATLTMVFGSLACADTYVVDPAGGGDYLTVARAARWAPEGSTVLVTAGEYEEAVRIEGRTSLTI
ncbi:MAG: hypothetical protein CMJ40_04660, partial [Phycisphaerae bacterium]|nr:hypothetical protein [Phycisphaerae bacterium]